MTEQERDREGTPEPTATPAQPSAEGQMDQVSDREEMPGMNSGSVMGDERPSDAPGVSSDTVERRFRDDPEQDPGTRAS